MALIPAFQKDEALLADIRATQAQASGFRIWWLGQSGFLLQHSGKHLLFDPYLSDSLSRKYAATDKPHTRVSELVIAPEKLDRLDVVTSSHNHTDHLDAETLLPIFAKNPGIEFVFPEANRAFVTERLGTLPQNHGLTDGLNGHTKSVEIQGFTITGVPAAHNTLERDEAGRPRFMGFVVQFDGYAIYHSGDTLWYEGLVDILRPYRLDVALLPINGNRPERRVAGNLDAEEAARLGIEIGAGCVIPHHYDLFAFNTEDPARFEHWAQHYPTPHKVLRLGEKWSWEV